MTLAPRYYSFTIWPLWVFLKERQIVSFMVERAVPVSQQQRLERFRRDDLARRDAERVNVAGHYVEVVAVDVESIKLVSDR